MAKKWARNKAEAKRLGIPTYYERRKQLARERGVPLSLATGKKRRYLGAKKRSRTVGGPSPKRRPKIVDEVFERHGSPDEWEGQTWYRRNIPTHPSSFILRTNRLELAFHDIGALDDFLSWMAKNYDVSIKEYE